MLTWSPCLFGLALLAAGAVSWTARGDEDGGVPDPVPLRRLLITPDHPGRHHRPRRESHDADPLRVDAPLLGLLTQHLDRLPSVLGRHLGNLPGPPGIDLRGPPPAPVRP